MAWFSAPVATTENTLGSICARLGLYAEAVIGGMPAAEAARLRAWIEREPVPPPRSVG